MNRRLNIELDFWYTVDQADGLTRPRISVQPSLHFMYAFPKISGVENLFLWRSGVSWRAATTIGVTLAQDAAALA